MGQKVNPIGLRLGINKTWDSRWFAEADYARQLHEDFAIRKYILDNYGNAAISRVVVERPARKANINIYTARPGVLIGKKGADIEKLKKKLTSMVSCDISINIMEIRKPELDATLVAQGIAQQLEKRVSFRRAMKRAMQSALRLGALGIRVNCAGRLAGAEIARTEWYREGRVPLHTFRSDVDYGVATAHTTYGTIGVKIWLYKGQILAHDPMASEKRMNEASSVRANR
jgi:small subunit ribosomal protein S3